MTTGDFHNYFAFVRKNVRLTPYEDHVILRNILSSADAAGNVASKACLSTYEKAFLFDAIDVSVKGQLLPQSFRSRTPVISGHRHLFRHLSPFVVR